MRLILGICAGENIPSPFLFEYWRLMQPEPIPMALAEGLYIQKNRNFVVKSALEYSGWERLLFIDTDMLFSPNLREIAESWEEPVVGGLYFRRRWPDYNPVPGYINDPEDPTYKVFTTADVRRVLKDPGLHPVDVLGTGCMGIRRDVLENWPEDKMPWFTTTQSLDGQMIISEDVSFCHKLHDQGIQPMLDTRIQCGHRGSIVVGQQTYFESVMAGEIVGADGDDQRRPDRGDAVQRRRPDRIRPAGRRAG